MFNSNRNGLTISRVADAHREQKTLAQLISTTKTTGRAIDISNAISNVQGRVNTAADDAEGHCKQVGNDVKGDDFERDDDEATVVGDDESDLEMFEDDNDEDEWMTSDEDDDSDVDEWCQDKEWIGNIQAHERQVTTGEDKEMKKGKKEGESRREGLDSSEVEDYYDESGPQRETPQSAGDAHTKTTLDEVSEHHYTSHPSMQVLLDYVKRYQDEHREGATEVFYSEDPVLRALQIDIRAVINPADVEWHNKRDGELSGAGKRSYLSLSTVGTDQVRKPRTTMVATALRLAAGPRRVASIPWTASGGVVYTAMPRMSWTASLRRRLLALTRQPSRRRPPCRPSTTTQRRTNAFSTAMAATSRRRFASGSSRCCSNTQRSGTTLPTSPTRPSRPLTSPRLPCNRRFVSPVSALTLSDRLTSVRPQRTDGLDSQWIIL